MKDIKTLITEMLELRKDKTLPYLDADLLYMIIIQQQEIIKLLEKTNDRI